MASTLVSTRVDRVSEVNMTALLRFDDTTNQATHYRVSTSAGTDDTAPTGFRRAPSNAIYAEYLRSTGRFEQRWRGALEHCKPISRSTLSHKDFDQ
jgi:hypothetical protein